MLITYKINKIPSIEIICNILWKIKISKDLWINSKLQVNSIETNSTFQSQKLLWSNVFIFVCWLCESILVVKVLMYSRKYTTSTLRFPTQSVFWSPQTTPTVAFLISKFTQPQIVTTRRNITKSSKFCKEPMYLYYMVRKKRAQNRTIFQNQLLLHFLNFSFLIFQACFHVFFYEFIFNSRLF